MRSCGDCRFNVKPGDRLVVSVCKQGHARTLNDLSKGTEIIPIQGCHAWGEKEKEQKGLCSCWAMMWGGVLEKFDITCKECGRKIQ